MGSVDFIWWDDWGVGGGDYRTYRIVDRQSDKSTRILITLDTYVDIFSTSQNSSDVVICTCICRSKRHEDIWQRCPVDMCIWDLSELAGTLLKGEIWWSWRAPVLLRFLVANTWTFVVHSKRVWLGVERDDERMRDWCQLWLTFSGSWWRRKYTATDLDWIGKTCRIVERHESCETRTRHQC